MSKLKRMLSTLLASCMMLTMLPVEAWAIEKSDGAATPPAQTDSDLQITPEDTRDATELSLSENVDETEDTAAPSLPKDVAEAENTAAPENDETEQNVPDVTAEEVTDPAAGSDTVHSAGDYMYTIKTVSGSDVATITKYTGNATTVQVPEKLDDYPVAAIGNGAFKGCTGLTNIKLPDSITSIGPGAFANCSNLTSVNYPMNWNYVGTSLNGSNIFAGCDKLLSITVPEGITEIPDYAFEGASSLRTVVFPSTLEKIGVHAFHKCTGLTNIGLPDSVTSISRGAFANCSNLTSINYPMNWSYVGTGLNGSNIFAGCDKLLSITVPEGITEIPDYVFHGASSLNTVILPSTLKKLEIMRLMGVQGLLYSRAMKVSCLRISKLGENNGIES